MAKSKDKNIVPKHDRFSFTEPRIVKTKKQWWIYYSIKYIGEKREYRNDYGGKDMQFNRIKDLTKRQIAMEVYISELKNQLTDGIDLKRVEEARLILSQQQKDLLKYDVQRIYDKWWEQSGYASPTPQKANTAMNFHNLFQKRFIPFLQQKRLMKDIRDIKKIHIKEFLNYYQFELKKWSRNTTKVKNQWLGSFFKFAVDNELIDNNPTHGIAITGTTVAKKARFQVFTKEEIDIVFSELESSKYRKLELLLKGLYYSYIRISEWLRLEYNNINFDKNIIAIRPDQSKTGSDGITRNVVIHPKLRETLIRYLADNDGFRPNDKLFANSRKEDKGIPITSMTMRAYWRDFFALVKEQYPDKFTRDGLSPYGFKHSGVTHFYYDNIHKNTSDKLLDFIKKQCRHKSITTTEKYLRDDLGIDIDGSGTFYDDLGIK